MLLGALVLLGASALVVYSWLKADANTRFGVIGVVGTLVSAVLVHKQTKKREADARMFAEKRKAYVGFLDLFFDMSGRVGDKPTDEQLRERMLEFKKALLVWGDTDAFALWRSLEGGVGNSKNPREVLLHLDKILRLMRKELGHDDSLLPEGELAASILVAEDRDMLRKPRS